MISAGSERIPMVPLREAVGFPHTMLPFEVGRRFSLAALRGAFDADRRVFLSGQRDASIAVGLISALAGIQTAVLPSENEADLTRIPAEVSAAST